MLRSGASSLTAKLLLCSTSQRLPRKHRMASAAPDPMKVIQIPTQPEPLMHPQAPDVSSSCQVPHESPPAPPPATEQNHAPDDEVIALDLEFVEEPLGIPAEQGYGYFQAEFGERIGPEQRYEIVKKLGWGMNSSVWLARDHKDDRYVSIKALKGYSSFLVAEGYMQEVQILHRLKSEPPQPGFDATHCLSMHTYFAHTGKEQDGVHVCIVTDVLGCHVNSLLKTFPTGALPLPLAKHALRHVLLGLAQMHRCGVAHTDLKGNNIMLDLGANSQQVIHTQVGNDPPRRHPPEPSWGKKVEVAVSQPPPLPSLEQALSRSFLIADFGSAQFCDRQVTDHITPDTLRAPETILKGPWNEKVDIWIFGCLVFEFLTGRSLFTRKSPTLEPDMMHLIQMMTMTGERFMPPQLQESKAALDFFDPKTCFLKGWPVLKQVRYQDMLSTYKTVGQADMDGAAGLMSKCLRLDPKNRPSAEELLKDSWLEKD